MDVQPYLLTIMLKHVVILDEVEHMVTTELLQKCVAFYKVSQKRHVILYYLAYFPRFNCFKLYTLGIKIGKSFTVVISIGLWAM
jgi:hypothetical protein